jgi:hypothetical protein
MELNELDERWCVSMAEGRVQRIEIDFRLGLLLSDGSETASLYIGVPCRLHGPNMDAWLIPGEPASLSPVLPFFNAEVANVDARKTGELSVEFRDGHCLSAASHEKYEAWEIGATIGFLMVCSPGGAITIFRQ